MAKGKYIVSYNSKQEILNIQIASDVDTDIPLDQQTLVVDVVTAFTLIRPLYNEDKPSYDTYFSQILNAAQLGLVGQNPQTSIAHVNIENIKTALTKPIELKVINLKTQPEPVTPSIVVGPAPDRCPCCGKLLTH